MSTGATMGRVTGATPRPRARMAGAFYLLTFLAGASTLVFHGQTFHTYAAAANLFAAACYVVVTLLFYTLFKPVSRRLSLLAAIFSLVGCAIGALGSFHLAPFPINALVFFGFYCLLIGSLILRSTFLPRILGVLMAFGGLGWLTFLSPQLAKHLAPYNLAPGMLGEGLLTLWLLVMGVNVPRWKQQAGASADPQW